MQPLQPSHPARLAHFASLLPGIAALLLSIGALMLPMLRAHAAEVAPAPQLLSLGQQQPYQFAVYANNALQQAPLAVTRAVVLVHGIKRNADDYYGVGQHLLANAGFTPADTLLLAPDFMTRSDPGARDDMPLWGGGTWMQGEPSEDGRAGLLSFQALDDLVRYLADRQRFPQLQQIVLIGHSAGAQLMQRYAALSDVDAITTASGIRLRLVISSPSSYVYFDANRPREDGFGPVASVMCPGYDNYRYGIANLPDYLRPYVANVASQQPGAALSGRQLFARYAARDITYMVGAHDDNPNHRFLDRACGARMQGNTRVERQLNFVRYEHFLSTQWNIPVNHPEFQVPGAAHEAERLYRSKDTARRVFGLP